MKNSIIAFVLFVLIALPKVYSQQMPFSSQYYSNQFITNPALTGNKGNTNAFLTHRSQYTGIAGGPQTTYFTIDGALKKDGVGLGLTLYSDVTDILSRTGFNASYSYGIKLDDANNHRLTFGLALGVVNNKVDFSKAVVVDLTDPILITQQQARTVANADFGLAYNFKKLEVGFAIPQIIGNKVDYKNNVGLTGTYNLARHYYGSLKYVFDVNTAKEFTAFPLLMVRSVAGAPFQYDVNAVVDWKKYGWVGVTYHSNYAVAISAGIRYKGLSVGYAYDLGISRIKSYTGSTSEFLLSYRFSSNEGDNQDVIEKLKTNIYELQAKDSLKEIEINKLKENDSIKDSLLLDLNQKSDSNRIEIEQLKEELKKISNKPTVSGDDESKKREAEKARLEAEIAAKQEKEDSLKMAKEMTEQGITNKVEPKNGYISIPDGKNVYAGFYVIIGAFTNVENAKVFTKDAKKKGYNSAEIIQNKNNQIYEIVVFKSESREPAIEKLEGIKKDYIDVWVLTLE